MGPIRRSTDDHDGRLDFQEAGLTPAMLAERVGVSRQVVANLEACKIEPGSDLIERIVVALGRRLRDFAEE